MVVFRFVKQLGSYLGSKILNNKWSGLISGIKVVTGLVRIIPDQT